MIHFNKFKLKKPHFIPKLNLPHIPRLFPHYSRRIHARLHSLPTRPFFLLITLLFIFLNLLSSITLNTSQNLVIKILKDPFIPVFHEKLGEILYSQRLYALGEKEYKIASVFSSQPPNVLGVALSPNDEYTLLQKSRQMTEDEINLWQTITRNYPEYEYGYLKLASLYHTIGDETKARETLNLLHARDPQNNDLQKLEKSLNSD